MTGAPRGEWWGVGPYDQGRPRTKESFSTDLSAARKPVGKQLSAAPVSRAAGLARAKAPGLGVSQSSVPSRGVRGTVQGA